MAASETAETRAEMTRDEALAEAIRLKKFFPFRIVGVVRYPNGKHEVVTGKTMAKFNNLMRKGCAVWLPTK